LSQLLLIIRCQTVGSESDAVTFGTAAAFARKFISQMYPREQSNRDATAATRI